MRDCCHGVTGIRPAATGAARPLRWPEREEAWMRLWGGRFGEPNDPRVIEFGRSIEVDRELAGDDIAASVAHVHGLGRAGILTADDVEKLVAGLGALGADVAAG